MQSDFLSMTFTTAGLAERDGIAQHLENLANALGAVELEPAEDAPFEADARLTATHGMGLATIGTSASRVLRRPDLNGDGEESFFVVMLAPGSGPIRLTQGKHDSQLAAGQAVLLRDTEAHRSTTRGARGHNLRLPNASLAGLLDNFDDVVGRVVPADAPGLSLLAGYLDGLHDALPSSPALRRLAPLHVCDLLTAVLGATRDAEEEARVRGVAAARLRAIKRDLAERLDSPDLTAESAGRRQGVSGRYVQKLFERDGTTFGTYLNRLRLEQARRRLVDPNAAHLSITEIAFDAGFNELSTFYRLFRGRFEGTPSDIRMRALADARRRH